MCVCAPSRTVSETNWLLSRCYYGTTCPREVMDCITGIPCAIVVDEGDDEPDAALDSTFGSPTGSYGQRRFHLS